MLMPVRSWVRGCYTLHSPCLNSSPRHEDTKIEKQTDFVPLGPCGFYSLLGLFRVFMRMVKRVGEGSALAYLATFTPHIQRLGRQINTLTYTPDVRTLRSRHEK